MQQLNSSKRLFVLLFLLASACAEQLEPSARQSSSVGLQVEAFAVHSVNEMAIAGGYAGIEYCVGACQETYKVDTPIYKDTLTVKTLTAVAVSSG